MDFSDWCCPRCKKKGGVTLLSTTNELKYYCRRCDQRFTEDELYDQEAS